MTTTSFLDSKPCPPASQSDIDQDDFPAELVGKKVLLATESLGPLNGVSRTTQCLVDYLRDHGVHVATCAPHYRGQAERKRERSPLVSKGWIRVIEAKAAALGSRAIGGAWSWHYERNDDSKHPIQHPEGHQPRSTRNRKDLPKRKHDQTNPDFRLQGIPLPYSPELTVAYPLRLSGVYDQTFVPDLIYLASPASVGFQFLLQLAQLRNPPPVLCNFQTDLSAYATILFPRPLSHYAVRLLHLVQGHLFRTPAVQKIYYPSTPVHTYLTSTGVPPTKLAPLTRGVSTTHFNPAHSSPTYRATLTPANEPLLLTVSRIAPEKGFPFLSHALLHLTTTHPHLPWKLLIVGSNANPAITTQTQQLFTTHPALRHRVIFAGALRGPALARAYASADVFLHPSVTETFGLTVLEAMASGLPVVARGVGGPREIVREGVTGFLTGEGDLEGFGGRVVELMRGGAGRRDLGERARREAGGWSWEAVGRVVAGGMVEALAERGPAEGEGECEGEGGGIGELLGAAVETARLYAAVAVVWVFWLVAVVPMLLCGMVHGLLR